MLMQGNDRKTSNTKRILRVCSRPGADKIVNLFNRRDSNTHKLTPNRMISKTLFISAVTILTGFTASFESRSSWYWNWLCKNEKCVKSPFPHFREDKIGATLDICKMTCGRYGSLWPRPTGSTTIGRQVIAFHPSKIKFDYSEVEGVRTTKEYLQRVSKIFQSRLLNECGEYDCSLVPETEVAVHFTVTSPDLKLSWETDESYALDLTTSGSQVAVKVRSKTVYGSRHALETLTQLITSYAPPSSTRSMRRLLVMVSSARVTDDPVYPHRGLLLDTARNFMSVTTIRRTLDAMAMTKLNVLHWHVTDSQSFPLETPRVPHMARYGAYSTDHIYTVHDAATIIEYARLRGIRVIIEIDAPAHAGNGWQWGESSNLGKLAVCVNEQPWRKYCIQPPCGQLNPVNPHVYVVLRDIFADIIDLTPPGEVFHMGGDEVFFPCWNSTDEIVSWLESQGLDRSQEDFLNLWATFQKTALQAFDEVNPVSNTSIMLWSSHLTKPDVIEKYLDKERYVIETWLEATSPIPEELLSKGYRLIMATKDKWYLDHGFWGNTVYHSWKVAYDNILPKHKNLLGGEATMWSELVDDSSVDVKIWPRAAAVAERLWTDPETTSRYAEPRLQQFRQRLVRRGISADALSPAYCYQNEGECF